jgi:hypothetical protein
MKRMCLVLLAAALPGLLGAQELKLNLEQLKAKSSEHVDLNLNGGTLQFAAKFLDSGDPEEAQVKKLVSGLEGIYVHHFAFKAPNGWSQADLDSVRSQLRSPEWARIVDVKSEEQGETDEVYLRTTAGKLSGVAIIAAEPNELTVIHIAGPIDLDALAALGGHMGIPKMKLPEGKAKPH